MNSILKNGVTILRCANWALNTLHFQIKKIVEQNSITNLQIKQFLDAIDQEAHGAGTIRVDISNFFDGQGLILLDDIVKKVIDNIEKAHTFHESLAPCLRDFEQKILN